MKFTILKWTEQNGNFTVTFSVASGKDERLDMYMCSVPFAGEDPQLFMNKLRNHMISHVAYIDNISAAKSIMTGYSFIDPTVHYYEKIGVGDVT